MRDSKRPTVVSLQFDKNSKLIIITDLNGEQYIFSKDDKDELHEAVLSIIKNDKLPELQLAQITVGQNSVNSSSNSGLNIEDLTNPDKIKSTVIAEGLRFLQNMSGPRR